VDEKNDQIAHHRIVAGRGILRNLGRNNNSPATGIPLHQLAVPRPPGTPYMGLFYSWPSPPPQLGFDQPLAQRLPANPDPVLLGELFGGASVGP
jgi:hypothetical protein